MSKEKIFSVNEVIKNHPSNYLSINKLIANARPDPTNLDWFKIQQAATNGDTQKVDDLLFDSQTNDEAKNLAKEAIFSVPSQPINEEHKILPNSNSILNLLAADGYIKIVNCIIDGQVNQITDLQEKIDDISKLKEIMKPEAQVNQITDLQTKIDDISKLKEIMKPEAQVKLPQSKNTLKEQLNDWQNSLELNIDNLLAIGVNRGNSKLIGLICKKFQGKLNLDKFNSSFPIYNTLLATAVKLNHPLVVETLLKNKADPNAGNGKVEMPLIHAIVNGNIKMFQILIKHGANLDVVAIHRGSIVDDKGQYKFFEKPINVEDAIKLAPNPEEMVCYINEIKSKSDFFKREMTENGPNSPIFSLIKATGPLPEITEENILGSNLEQTIEEQ